MVRRETCMELSAMTIAHAGLGALSHFQGNERIGREIVNSNTNFTQYCFAARIS
jgi:hypothetical protein